MHDAKIKKDFHGFLCFDKTITELPLVLRDAGTHWSQMLLNSGTTSTPVLKGSWRIGIKRVEEDVSAQKEKAGTTWVCQETLPDKWNPATPALTPQIYTLDCVHQILHESLENDPFPSMVDRFMSRLSPPCRLPPSKSSLHLSSV